MLLGWIALTGSGVIAVAGALRYVFLTYVGDATALGSMDWLDINVEQSVATWWTSLMWLALSAYLIAAGLSAGRKMWFVLSGGALLLSLDEIMMIHESVGHLVAPFVEGASGIWASKWVLVGVPAVIICLLALLPFVRSLPRRTAVGLVASGTLFVAGAVGCEMLFGAAKTEWAWPDWAVLTLIVAEEALEMLGVASAIAVMVDYLYPRATAAKDALRQI